MGRAARLARRTFLIGAAAVAGGLVVGTVAYRRDPRNPLLDDLATGAASLNPYVRIDAEGVTLITPRADLGQGAISVQAALLAEELDLAWGQFKTDPGPPSAAYYNGHVVAEGIPVAATRADLTVSAARLASDVIGKWLGQQITGGSTTVPDAFDRLRTAGAAARQMLLAAAAQQSGLPIGQLTTQDGAVRLPDGRMLSYVTLAAAAAAIRPPAEVALKPMSQWRLLGKPMPRLDIVPKSTGAAVYGIDLRLPGMLHATVRTNPRLGGGVLGIDATEALTLRGVLKVVPLPTGFGVIADNTWRAFQAAERVKVDWAPSPFTGSSTALAAELVGAMVDTRRDSRFRNDGDVDTALAGGDVIEAEYRVPYLAHAPLEPMNAVVRLEAGRLDIWTGTQIPRDVVAMAARVAGLDPSAVRLHAQISGGSFGRRLESDYVEQAVRLAIAHPGPPIKMTWSREQDMAADMPRPFAIARARGRVRQGRIEAVDLAIASTSVTSSQLGRLGLKVPGPDVAIVAGAWDQPFAIEHYRVTGYRAPPSVPVSSWRSVGASGNGFLHECFIDELIVRAGADPLAERLRLCRDEPSRAVLRAVGQMCGWSRSLPAGRGRGLAFTLSFGVPVAEVVEVTATPRGIRIDEVFVACDVGRVIDPVNLEAQLQGAVIWGLGHAINCELTYVDGVAQQTNFHQHAGLRLHQTPRIHVRALETNPRIRGIGEPGVPPAAPALANAIFAATGKRIRELPLVRHIEFL